MEISKALSIRQPYATLIAEGIKDIENRSFRTTFRGTFYIHASGTWHDRIKSNSTTALFTEEQYYKIDEFVRQKSEKELMSKQAVWRYLVPAHGINTLPLGAVIGQVDLVDCVKDHSSIWAEKINDQVLGEFYEKPIWNWVLHNPVLYDKPILNVKGKLSLWVPDNHVFGALF